MKRTTIATLASFTAIAALGLSACSSGSTPAASSPASSAPTTSTQTVPSPTEMSTPAATESTVATDSASPTATEQTSAAPTSSPSDTAAAGGALKIAKASSKTVKYPLRGDSATVTGVATGFVGEGDWAKAPGQNTYVGIKYDVTRGEKYYGGVSCTTLTLSTPEMGAPTSDSTSVVKDAMKEAGLTPLESSIDSGAKASGWCMYYVKNPTATNLTVTYSELPTKVSGKTYPAFKEDMPIKVG